MSEATPSSGPTADERQSQVDALRGFALLGILVVNIEAFASPYFGLPVSDPMMTRSGLDRFTSFATAFLFESKFYLLFSFLFGYSFRLQMQAARRSDRPFVPRMARRLLGLWVIGLLHAVLLFHGDILTTYALLGTVLLLVRGRDDAFLTRWALRLVLATVLLWAGIGALTMAIGVVPDTETDSALAEAAAASAAYRGTPMTVIHQHLRELSRAWVWVGIGLLHAPMVVAMFLVGFTAGRRQLFAQPGHYLPLCRRWLVPSLLIGLPGALAYAWTSTYLEGTSWHVFGIAIGQLTSPLLSAGYVAGALLLFQTQSGLRLAGLLASAGRMALSNYLLQSLVCAWIFLAYGLRLMGQVGPFASLALALVLFCAQLVLSRWWMRRFAYGPVEWLLRAFTHLERPPIRRSN